MCLTSSRRPVHHLNHDCFKSWRVITIVLSCRVNFCAGRKTAWNWQGTSPSSIASRKTAANTFWSLTRPRKKTAATTRLKQMAESRWLNSWCRVSVSHAVCWLLRVQYELLLSVTNAPSVHSSITHRQSRGLAAPLAFCLFLGYSGSCRYPHHSAKVTAVMSACLLKLGYVDHISPEGHRSAQVTWRLSFGPLFFLVSLFCFLCCCFVLFCCVNLLITAVWSCIIQSKIKPEIAIVCDLKKYQTFLKMLHFHDSHNCSNLLFQIT